MPYDVKKKDGGYKVCKPTGKCFSKKAMTKGRAEKQRRALYANVEESFNQLVERLLKELLQ